MPRVDPRVAAMLAAKMAGPRRPMPPGMAAPAMPPGAMPPPGGMPPPGMKRGGKTKKMAAGGSASSRADGIAARGKTVGKFC